MDPGLRDDLHRIASGLSQFGDDEDKFTVFIKTDHGELEVPEKPQMA